MTRPTPEQIKEINKQIIAAFRESGGVGSHGPVEFGRCVLLTTTGRRSGRSRTVPLGYVRDDTDALLLFGSNLGAPRDPDWVHNVRAHPHVTVEITGASWDADAVVLQGADRDAAYERWIAEVPNVAGHQEQAGRTIPMIRVPKP